MTVTFPGFSDIRVELSPDGCVRQPGAPNFAGSALTMAVAVANTARFCGLTLDEVLPLATTNPARAVGSAPAGTVTAHWDAANHHLKVIHVAD